MLEKSLFFTLLECGSKIVSDVCVSLVSDLQEEGKYAINAPLLPSSTDLLPEDMLLGNTLLPRHQFNLIYSFTTRRESLFLFYFLLLLILNTLCFQYLCNNILTPPPLLKKTTTTIRT